MRAVKSFLVIAALFFILQSPAFAEEQAGPNLWKTSDEDTTVYIFGTIHLLNEEVEWVTPQLHRAFQEADALVLELAPDQQEPALMQWLIRRYGLLPDGETLQTRLSEEEYATLTGALEGLGTPGNALDPLQPWLAATILTVQVAGSHGFLPEFGVEKILEQNAADNDMPIYGLETAEFQISTLAGLSRENQQTFLSQALEELGQIDDLFVEMRDAWLAGDTEGLDIMLNDGLEEMPELAEAILYQRNRNWAGKIDSMLEELEGTVLIAVGTGHLVGEKSLLEILGKNGLEVTLVK